MFRKGLFLGAAIVATMAVPGTAFADSCSNVSRPAPACDLSCTSAVVDGNWVWLPSIGIPDPVWGFSPPGTPTSNGLLGIQLPDANGNYLNQQGNFAWLLENSKICSTGGVPNRQTTHGIQSGCGA